MKYVAFIRGIGPTDGNDKLRRAFEKSGFGNVSSLLSSGNILFESDEKDAAKLESIAEKAIESELGRFKAVIIRNKKELDDMTAKNPFAGMTHTPKTSLNVTFLKHIAKTTWKFPRVGKSGKSTAVAMHDREVYAVLDSLSREASAYMGQLEKEFGKDITTRTWQTIQRVLNRMGNS